MRAVIVAVVLTGSLVATASVRASENSVNEGIAERMTREAIAAGAAGDLQLRAGLLEQATRIAPDHAPARWAQGEMDADGEWKSVAAVQDAARKSEPRKRYSTMKARLPGTPADHLELARWCRNNDLDDEARYHWLHVLAADADHREALRALDSVWIDGKLVPRDEAEAQEIPRREVRQQNREWRTRIAGWERALAAGGDQATRALAELDADVDESAIAAFESLAAGKRGTTTAESERHQQLCTAFVEALGNLPSYEASESLVRFAVLADNASLRTAAGRQLCERPQHEVVPQLVAGLGSMIESRFDVSRSPTGRVSYNHELYAEGPAKIEVAELSKSATAPLAFPSDASDEQVARAAQRAGARSTQQLGAFWAEARRLHQLAESVNASREELNARITPVLAEITGQDFGSDPTKWWDYWGDYNGYESYRPTETYRMSLSYVEPVRPSCECFAAGTLVWTKTGMEPIESITAGDLVLTMDVETGERCFRPVLSTTRRPPSKLMHVATGSYQMLATPGHPFWVEGHGWKMAKELRVGDYIATAEGAPQAVRVLAGAETEQEAFNLVVDGNNNYYVGVEGLLTHDNTRRDPELVRAGQ